jgi:hypothetical protein
MENKTGSMQGNIMGIYLFIYLFIYGTGIWTQGLELARQVLYHLSQASSSSKQIYEARKVEG